MYFCGAKMVDTTGLGPVLDGMGLNNGIGSYGGRVTFCFTADRDALPDPEFYEDCLAGAVDELLEVAPRTTGATVDEGDEGDDEGFEGEGPRLFDQGWLRNVSAAAARLTCTTLAGSSMASRLRQPPAGHGLLPADWRNP